MKKITVLLAGLGLGLILVAGAPEKSLAQVESVVFRTRHPWSRSDDNAPTRGGQGGD